MLYGQRIHVWINLSQETQGTDLCDFFFPPFMMQVQFLSILSYQRKNPRLLLYP